MLLTSCFFYTNLTNFSVQKQGAPIFYDYRNKGIATKLMDKAESRIKEKGYKTVGLGVGLYSDYGTAQRMYVKRGYNFDGRGINYDGKILKPGTNVRVDDSLGLCMTKELYNTVK